MTARSRLGTFTLYIAVATVVMAPAMAQDPSPEKYLELLRSDLRTGKVEVLTEALDLTEPQAQAFWPIYREYDAAASAIGDRRVALVKRFAEKYGTIADEEAGVFAKEWFDIQKDRMKLREKYFGKVAKATSNKVAARFTQVEYTIDTLMDLQIAAELPLMQ